MNQAPSAAAPQGRPSTMKWLLIVLVLVIVLGGGYWVYTKYGKSTLITTTITSPTVTSSPTKSAGTAVSPSASITVPADWETYTNEKYKYTFKYPNTGSIEGETSAVLTENNKTILNIVIIQTQQSLDDYIKDAQSQAILQNPQKITINGNAGYEGIDSGMTTVYVVYLKNNNIIFRLMFDTNSKDTLQDLKNGLSENQKGILSTFQFTNHNL